ncbi:alpha/beta hydrolase [Nonomuraea insulae]|uniref:Alpha/beta hydrolase n=1 Tax=Nonomuraea insulae TaxID=1616787 RepID=A0ABW1CF77_9ACTN
MTVEHVTFPAGGAESGITDCAADLYLPEGASRTERRPGIILFWSGTVSKEANTGAAWYLARAGYACLAMDFRTSGASAGTPRGQLYPDNFVQDVRCALFYLSSRPEVDPERIGLHGVSLGGGVALQVAAFDRRVRCVSVLYPSALMGWAQLPQDMIQNDIAQRVATGRGATRQFVGVDTWTEPARGYARQATELYPTFDNTILVESFEKMTLWNPARFADKISPTPVQFLGVSGDDAYHDLTQMRQVMEDSVREPKRMVVLPYDSMGLYIEPGLGEGMRATIEWFDHHLLGRPLTRRFDAGGRPAGEPRDPATTPLAPDAQAAGLCPGFANWQPSWDPATER